MLLLPLLLAGTISFVDDSATGTNDGSSWANAFTDLQSALATSQSAGDQIWVAAGRYRPSTTGDRGAAFLLRNREVYGGFAGTEATLADRAGLFDQTILDGDLAGNDAPGFQGYAENGYHVVMSGGAYVLDGFTVRHGYTGGPGSIGKGAGLSVSPGSSGVVRNCVFVENRSDWLGGGVDLGDSVAHFTRCTFLGNSAFSSGGGVYQGLVSPGSEFDNCRFLGNAAQEGGGVSISDGTFRGCEFSGNVALEGLGGGGILATSNLVVTNCTFSRNEAQWTIGGGGGLFYIENGPIDPVILGSIFSENHDSNGTGFMSQLRVFNLDRSAHLKDSCVPEFHPSGRGTGNLRGDPHFVDPIGADGVAGTLDDDLRLRASSPCIDRAGDEALPTLLPTDLTGRPRAVDALSCGEGGVLDMGAYESQVVQGTTNYCAATPTSLGLPAQLFGPCQWTIAAGDLDLSAAPVPPGHGMLFFGANRTQTPFGDGFLCIAGPLHRAEVAASSGGVLTTRVDFDAPGNAALLQFGTTWSFQALFRDPAAGGSGFNLSDAISVTLR